MMCLYRVGDHRDLHVLTHSFPTRRSSVLSQPEQVGVREYHAGRGLKVRGLEAIGGGKFDAAPEVGLQVVERDANPGDLVGHAAMLTGALCAVQFHGMISSHRDAGQPEAIFSMTSAI